MEAGRARNRDNPGLPTLSLGLSSVRHIVTKLEAEYARVVTTNAFKSEIVKYNPCCEDNDYYNYSFDTKVLVLNRFVVNLGVALAKCIPSVTLANFGFLAVTTGLFAPRMISYLVLYPFCRLVFGTLYPAYASYKAVRTKNLKEYVKWMMYWIVFALFTCTETFTDVFLSWFPFYYEVKIVLVLWLLSPATKGSSILYRKFVHPALCRREQEIDEYIAKAKDQGYHTVLNLGTKGVNYATTVIMQTAIKNLNLPNPDGTKRAITDRDVTDGYNVPDGYNDYEDMEFQRENTPGVVEIVELDNENAGDGDNDPDYEPTSARSRGNVVRKRKNGNVKEKKPRSRSRGRRTRSQAAMDNKEVMGGGGLVQQLRKSYSLSDLTECEPREERGADEADDVLAEPRLIRRAVKSGYATRRSASESNRSMYFPEVDVDVRGARVARIDEPDFSHIKSTEDISSGYSSAENSASLTRTASVGGRSRARTSRTTITTIKRPQAAEDNQVIIEEVNDDESIDYNNMPPLVNFTSQVFLSHTDPPFLYQYVGDQVKIIQVLGSYPLSNNIKSHTDQSDKRDQREASVENLSPPIKIHGNKDIGSDSSKEEAIVDKDPNTNIPSEVITEIKDNNNKTKCENIESLDIKQESKIALECNLITNLVDTSIQISKNQSEDNNSEEFNDTISVNISINDYDTVESDDEMSFETPVSTPKSNRKFIKGKYGKEKAPLPPNTNISEGVPPQLDLELNVEQTRSEENLNDDAAVENQKDINVCEPENISDTTPIKDTVDEKTPEVTNLTDSESTFINSDSDKNRRHKSKSPARTSKSSALGKLLQLPGKLAFWHKNDDKHQPDISDVSRRSSENAIDEFQSCSDLNQNHMPQIAVTEPTPPVDELNENMTNNILEKSDALQKAIDAKLENNPEYKFVSLHADVPTMSKSTDV